MQHKNLDPPAIAQSLANRPDLRDCIAAPATAPGASAIAIVRLDGESCLEILGKIWAPGKTAATIGGTATLKPRHMTHGHIYCNGAPLDEVLGVYFAAPQSYTGNDLVELHCHGSPAIIESLMQACLQAGARMARPGEFTERAFFNGQLDLAQAEAVANLIASQTEQAARSALMQLDGALSKTVQTIRDELLDVAAEIEARLDFPEEEVPPQNEEKIQNLLQTNRASLTALLSSARRGRLLRDGARIVMAGRPNAGKSSLFNALVGIEKAIVTPHPGTTRDTLEATLDLKGIPLTLIDTAGLREIKTVDKENDPQQIIEQMGAEKALTEVRRADLTLLVVDASHPPGPEEHALAEAIMGRPFLLVENKSDLPRHPQTALQKHAAGAITCSALEKKGLKELEEAITGFLLGMERENLATETPLVTNLRHLECLQEAAHALDATLAGLHKNLSPELIMVELYESLNALGRLVGLDVSEAVLGRIFSRFCIGK